MNMTSNMGASDLQKMISVPFTSAPGVPAGVRRELGSSLSGRRRDVAVIRGFRASALARRADNPEIRDC
jgi:hypothetical protein